MNTLSKVIKVKDLIPKVSALKKAGKKVVFTNGCFDILHVGHVRYLSAARFEGDILVVGLNSDESARSIKGPKRPIVSQAERAEVLSSLWCVDYVVLFHDPDPSKLIQAIGPDLLVKGDDWAESDIIGADFVRAKGGKILRVPVVSGASTSRIIEKVVNLYRQVK